MRKNKFEKIVDSEFKVQSKEATPPENSQFSTLLLQERCAVPSRFPQGVLTNLSTDGL